MYATDVDQMERMQALERERQTERTRTLARTHPLEQLFWECTLRCNLACRHCGSDCLKVADTPDMPLEDFLAVLDEIKAHQPDNLPIIYPVGGEPLVREDLCRCGEEFTRRGFRWGTVTNGMLLTADKLREMIDAGLRSIAIDLDGLRDHHAWLRRSDTSFDRAMQAVSLLRETSLAWDVITCVNRRNVGSLPQIRAMLTEAGVRRWRCFTIFPAGRADGDDELQLTDDELRALMDFIVETRFRGDIDLSYSCEAFLGPYEGYVRDYHYSCRAGLTVASVRANGDISGCLSIRSHYSQGNIYRDSFMEVWEHRFGPFRDRRWMHRDECARCDMYRWCGGNGFHLRRDDGSLMTCHYHRLFPGEKTD